MPEPLKELVSLAFRDLLRAIEGDGGVTRHYTPTMVVRADDFDEVWLDSSIEGDQVLIFVIPDQAEDEEATYTATQTRQTFNIVAAKVYTPAQSSPLQDGYDDGQHPIRETVQHRLEADIKNQVRGNRTLTSEAVPNGLALHTSLGLTEKGPQDTWHEGWAVVFIQAEVTCIHEDTAA